MNLRKLGGDVDVLRIAITARGVQPRPLPTVGKAIADQVLAKPTAQRRPVETYIVPSPDESITPIPRGEICRNLCHDYDNDSVIMPASGSVVGDDEEPKSTRKQRK